MVLEIETIEPIYVVSQTLYGDLRSGEYSQQIADQFKAIEEWLREVGVDPRAGRTIGVTLTGEEGPVGYQSCVEVSRAIQEAPEGFQLQELPGGRFAVTAIPKDPDTIGPNIGRIYSQLLPEQGLVVDPARPAYEIYFEKEMEYWVAILS